MKHPLTTERITELALANGFKLKAQPGGTEALNPYVFDFAAALLEEKGAEIAALRKDAERYREFRKGKALTIKCGKLTIFTGSNPDYERKYPEALDAAIDAAMAAELGKAVGS